MHILPFSCICWKEERYFEKIRDILRNFAHQHSIRTNPRTDSFSELLQTLRKLRKRPKLLLIENVQGFEQSEMRRRLVETLAGKLADNPLATDGDGLSIAGATAGGQECESGKREAGLGYQVEEFLLDPRQVGQQHLCQVTASCADAGY
eukprot:SAG31_NODE_953_length_10799_cov_4.245657_4_plen_149_part_00